MSMLMIRDEKTAEELRRLARPERDARVGRRMLAIANALDGMIRATAAKLAGMDRQTLRDWVIRYNEHGVAELGDHWVAISKWLSGPLPVRYALSIIDAYGKNRRRDGELNGCRFS